MKEEEREKERERREKGERGRERRLAHNTGTNLGRATRGEQAFFLAALSFCPIYGERDEGEERRGERDGRKRRRSASTSQEYEDSLHSVLSM